jgi:hypothetical protein
MSELCRALLRAEKFSLAKSYLRGTGSVGLQPEAVMAAYLVPPPFRGFFFSPFPLLFLFY